MFMVHITTEWGGSRWTAPYKTLATAKGQATKAISWMRWDGRQYVREAKPGREAKIYEVIPNEEWDPTYYGDFHLMEVDV